jgi:hypothetical protein
MFKFIMALTLSVILANTHLTENTTTDCTTGQDDQDATRVGTNCHDAQNGGFTNVDDAVKDSEPLKIGIGHEFFDGVYSKIEFVSLPSKDAGLVKAENSLALTEESPSFHMKVHMIFLNC